MDSAGNIFITGYSSSPNFPTKSVFNRIFISNSNLVPNTDVFLTKFLPTFKIDFSTHFGGNEYDSATSLAVDSKGNSYITGYTTSKDFLLKILYLNHMRAI